MINLPAVDKEIFIPNEFKEGQFIEQVVIISDVDGVIREGVEATADPRIISSIKNLLENKNVEVIFISGTHVDNMVDLETWRKGNLPLKKVFGSAFDREIIQDRVSIYGVLGGHRLKGDGTVEVMNQYSGDISFELAKLLIEAFLNGVLHQGTPQQKEFVHHLKGSLDSIHSKEGNHSSNATPQEFQEIVFEIRKHLDPHFRLISNGALIETHTSNPPWNTQVSSKWLLEQLNQPQYAVSHLPQWEKKVATGFGKREDLGFDYLLISKTNKGLATKKEIEEKMRRLPNALVITIGDTQVDFPMHQNAHLAFHVGTEAVWESHPLPNCVMIRNREGQDSQHLEGTLKVLELLQKDVGKSFFDFKYIPRCNSIGEWYYYSLKEIFAF